MPDFKKRPPTEEGSNSPAVRPQDELRRNYRDAKAKSGATPQPPNPGYESLRAYFYSGWAFLIPYLAAYLLYAWLKWPVNPEIHSENSKLGVGGSWVPCLLHLYWSLHAAHVFLGIAALKIWWQKGERHPGDDLLHLSEESPILNRLWPILPWLLLALVFWIPGVYLEWPSDPWEHLRRINEWHVRDIVSAHSSWMKSSYFIPYSMLNWTTGLRQVFWLDFYYTGMCLLLCWQYYRLALSCDLGKHAATAFVILQALVFGNNLFSFYRYYGISSSIYSQIGATALIRIAIEIGKKTTLRELWSYCIGERWSPSIYAPLFSCLSLLTLVAFTHPQGIGITVLGITAVIFWRVTTWRRSMGIWLVLIAGGLSAATIFWYPRSASLDHIYRSEGWLSAWYGFNVFSPSSPAFNRTVQILGTTGMLNLFVGFWLLRRNHIVAWLTILPIILLGLPLFAIPFLQLLIYDNQPVIVFQRLLFSTPTALALVALLSPYIESKKRGSWEIHTAPPKYVAIPNVTPFGHSSVDNKAVLSKCVDDSFSTAQQKVFHYGSFSMIFGLCAFILLPVGNPNFNRDYNLLYSPPADLSMHHALLATEYLASKSNSLAPKPTFLATTGISFVANTTGLSNVAIPTTRAVFALPRDKTVQCENYLISSVRDHAPAVFFLQSANDLYTPFSQTAYLSKHWDRYEVASEYSGGPEAQRIASMWGYHKTMLGHFAYYIFQPD